MEKETGKTGGTAIQRDQLKNKSLAADRAYKFRGKNIGMRKVAYSHGRIRIRKGIRAAEPRMGRDEPRLQGMGRDVKKKKGKRKKRTVGDRSIQIREPAGVGQ